MGMNYYAETGYGLFLTDDEMMIFARKIYEEDEQKFETLPPHSRDFSRELGGISFVQV